MASLNGQTPADTYEGLLKTNDNGTMPSGNDPAEVVTDGAGNASDLKLHNNHIEVRRLKTSIDFGDAGKYLGQNGNGVLNWKDDGLAPSGGASGQVLTKVDGTNYNYSWQDAGGGIPTPPSFVGHSLQVINSAGDIGWRPNYVDYGTTNFIVGASSATYQLSAYYRIGQVTHCVGAMRFGSAVTIKANAIDAYTSNTYIQNLPFSATESGADSNFNKSFAITSTPNSGWPPGFTYTFNEWRGGTIGQWSVVSSTGVLLKTGVIAFGSTFNSGTAINEFAYPIVESANYTIASGDTFRFDFKYIAV